VISGGADLHLHSRRSDGTDEPGRLVERAASLGLEAISLTDHDTVAGVEETLEAGWRLGVRVLPGAEFSAEFKGHEIHLLAYAFDPRSSELRKALEEFRRERERRAERIVERLNELGIRLSMEQVRENVGEASLGRPHLADALLRTRAVSPFQEAFNRFLNPGRPAFIPRARFSLEAARRVTWAAKGVLILAHPHLNLSSGNIQALLEEGIDGLETAHAKLKPSQCRELSSLAAKRGVLQTGGSDCHGERRGPIRLGTIRVSVENVDRIERVAAERGASAAGKQG